MKVIMRKSLLNFITSEYDDSFDPWYSNFLPLWHDAKPVKGGMVEVNLDENVWNTKHEANALSWFKFILESDSDPYGRLWDRYQEMNVGEKSRVRAFCKNAKFVLAQISDYTKP